MYIVIYKEYNDYSYLVDQTETFDSLTSAAKWVFHSGKDDVQILHATNLNETETKDYEDGLLDAAAKSELRNSLLRQMETVIEALGKQQRTIRIKQQSVYNPRYPLTPEKRELKLGFINELIKYEAELQATYANLQSQIRGL